MVMGPQTESRHWMLESRTKIDTEGELEGHVQFRQCFCLYTYILFIQSVELPRFLLTMSCFDRRS